MKEIEMIQIRRKYTAAVKETREACQAWDEYMGLVKQGTEKIGSTRGNKLWKRKQNAITRWGNIKTEYNKAIKQYIGEQEKMWDEQPKSTGYEKIKAYLRGVIQKIKKIK